MYYRYCDTETTTTTMTMMLKPKDELLRDCERGSDCDLSSSSSHALHSIGGKNICGNNWQQQQDGFRGGEPSEPKVEREPAAAVSVCANAAAKAAAAEAQN